LVNVTKSCPARSGETIECHQNFAHGRGNPLDSAPVEVESAADLGEVGERLQVADDAVSLDGRVTVRHDTSTPTPPYAELDLAAAQAKTSGQRQ